MFPPFQLANAGWDHMHGPTPAAHTLVPPPSQRGAVLAISLVILLLLTLIGVTAMSTTTLEEKMAGNTRDLNLAFQAAEAALREGEAWVMDQTVEPDTCDTAPCDVWELKAATEEFASQSHSWWTANAREYGTAGGNPDIDGVSSDPRFLIEYLSFESSGTLTRGQDPQTGDTFYRITARGTGGTNDAQVILQSIVKKQFN